MRILTITVVAGLVALAPVRARADQRADLQSKGEQQAKEGRFQDAIDSFKNADKIQARASHACLIALAYTRRELWSQSQLWLSKCQERASASDPMPDWAPTVEQQIKDRLATANVAPVTIVVKPSTVKVKLTLSSFAPDETFEPRTIHLAPGTHVVFAKGEGLPERQQTFELRDKTPQTITIDYSDVAPKETPKPDGNGIGSEPAPMPEGPAGPSNGTSTGLLIGGGAAVVFGGITHLLMWRAATDMNTAKDDANNAPDPDTKQKAIERFESAGERYDRYRIMSIAGYVVGAGLIVTGYLTRKKLPTDTTVSAAPLPEGGAFVSVGWSR